MLWPHYLRTIPSLSIVALTPTLPAMKIAETVPAGFEISSRPLGPKNTVCRYRTTRDLTLNPLAIDEAMMTAEPDGRSACDYDSPVASWLTGRRPISAAWRCTWGKTPLPAAPSICG
ncbi:protein ImpG/VasA [Klebsiella pneumoniae]|nr:protein ImpG/VasA [Klebsiella pneumoniae]